MVLPCGRAMYSVHKMGRPCGVSSPMRDSNVDGPA